MQFYIMYSLGEYIELSSVVQIQYMHTTIIYSSECRVHYILGASYYVDSI